MAPRCNSSTSSLKLVAPLSLGGILLILFSLNVMINFGGNQRDFATDRWQANFHIDNGLSVQTWVALLGLCFGALSYGMGEAYIHFFD
ncbi:hypothetical protein CEP54_014821 [Fusarium duplospermum]|uniref:Uncharacterized protein n=1 Tax=Fusarium duplospermum TaxID=1325734 RepID=A0A428NTN6_9HYPO|nr:hypothetical protein CEP54_014821 [Fusarium duplospermum]